MSIFDLLFDILKLFSFIEFLKRIKKTKTVERWSGTDGQTEKQTDRQKKAIVPYGETGTWLINNFYFAFVFQFLNHSFWGPIFFFIKQLRINIISGCLQISNFIILVGSSEYFKILSNIILCGNFISHGKI